MIHIPSSLRENILTTYSEQGRLWLEALPSLVETYLQLWNLDVIGKIENQTFNFVLRVRLRQDGTHAILKAGPHKKGRLREAEMLLAYNSGGLAPALLNFSEKDGILLLAAVEPGDSLESALVGGSISEVLSTEKAALMMTQVLNQVTLRSANKKISSIEIWGLGFEKFLRESCRGILFPPTLIERADEVFKFLHSTSTEQILLHGDLHHANILLNGRGDLLLIDPKGVYGDPAFEVGAFMRNPIQTLCDHPALDQILIERISIFSDVLKLDRQRIWGWSFSQSVLAAIWTVEDKSRDYRQWIKVAEAFLRIENKI